MILNDRIMVHHNRQPNQGTISIPTLLFPDVNVNPSAALYELLQSLRVEDTTANLLGRRSAAKETNPKLQTVQRYRSRKKIFCFLN
jgi:hypothetical protein